MDEKSTATHEFRHGKARGDHTCLYWSFLLVFKLPLIQILGEDLFNKVLTKGLIEDKSKKDLIEAINENLRIEVANYIRRHTEMHRMVLSSTDKYKTVQEYCFAIEQGKFWGGDPELKALSDLFNIIICVIDWTKITSDNCLLPSYYGEDNPLATECVYIYYNGKDHFDPLYMINIENTNDIETISLPNDQTVIDLLKKCIKEKCNRDIKLGLTIAACVKEVERPTETSLLNETEKKSDLIILNPNMNVAIKRKSQGHASLLFAETTEKYLSSWISNKNDASNKRAKVIQDATDQMSTFYKNKPETITTKDHIQVEDICGESDPTVIQQQIADLPMSLNDEHQEEKVEGEKEPDNKLHDGVQDSDKVNYNSESSETKSVF